MGEITSPQAEDVLSLVLVLLHATFIAIIDSIKALLPMGVVPRKSVRGEKVLITGSASGIGRLMAIEFAKLGAELILWDVQPLALQETKKIVENQGAKASIYQVDLSDRKAIAAAVEKVKSEVGDVDILINNAGMVTGKKILDCPDELMEKTLAVNANALLFVTKPFLRSMIHRNHGHVVVTASMAGVSGIAGLVDYCSSKFAAVGFGESLAAELQTIGKDGVHTTTICPSYINTGMFDGVTTRSPFFVPFLEPEYVVDRIMEAILTNEQVVYTPKFMYFFAAFKGIFPVRATYQLARWSGLNQTMDTFKGRVGDKALH